MLIWGLLVNEEIPVHEDTWNNVTCCWYFPGTFVHKDLLINQKPPKIGEPDVINRGIGTTRGFTHNGDPLQRKESIICGYPHTYYSGIEFSSYVAQKIKKRSSNGAKFENSALHFETKHNKNLFLKGENQSWR
jgi:hypothetical protein